jgi:hypothetical protein
MAGSDVNFIYLQKCYAHRHALVRKAPDYEAQSGWYLHSQTECVFWTGITGQDQEFPTPRGRVTASCISSMCLGYVLSGEGHPNWCCKTIYGSVSFNASAADQQSLAQNRCTVTGIPVRTGLGWSRYTSACGKVPVICYHDLGLVSTVSRLELPQPALWRAITAIVTIVRDYSRGDTRGLRDGGKAAPRLGPLRCTYMVSLKIRISLEGPRTLWWTLIVVLDSRLW